MNVRTYCMMYAVRAMNRFSKFFCKLDKVTANRRVRCIYQNLSLMPVKEVSEKLKCKKGKNVSGKCVKVA
jgi:hypothetical protein